MARPIRSSIALVALVFVAVLPAGAQQLEIGRKVAGTLEAKAAHTYTVATEANWFVYGYVDQLTLDVVVRILGANGKEIASFDSPARGPEPFQFTPDEPGVYTIEVKPFEGAEGNYEVLLVANEPKATDAAGLVDQVMKPFTGYDRPGAVISVVKKGEVVLAKGYGMSNLTYGVPMTPETGMSIASVSKHFTAMALLLLQQDGKLSLEDDVRKHIPELKDFGTPVTLRHMLNHTSGYREILNFLPISGSLGTDGMARDEPVRVIQRQTSLQNAPGAEYNYNNTTFMLLATVVERVSGKPFDEFMRERVFVPLGMNQTRIKTVQGQVIENSSQGYANGEQGGFVSVMDFASAYGASGVNSTALDMTRWMANFRDGTVGGPEAIASLTTRGILTNGDTTSYALGLGVQKWRGRTLYTHTGGETSHRTWFGWFPEFDSGIFFSSNHPSFSLGIWTDLAEAFFAEHLGPKEPGKPDSTADATITVPVERLNAIAGTWRFVGAPLMIEYTVDGTKLFAQATNQPKFEVEPTSDSTFTFVGVEARVTFHFESDGTAKRATHHQGPDSPMEKVTKPALTADELAAYAGRYYNDELETFYTIYIEDGKLMGRHRRIEPFRITHTDGDEFAGGIWFFGTLKFDRDPTGAVTGFMGSNGRTRNVWFRKVD